MWGTRSEGSLLWSFTGRAGSCKTVMQIFMNSIQGPHMFFRIDSQCVAFGAHPNAFTSIDLCLLCQACTECGSSSVLLEY